MIADSAAGYAVMSLVAAPASVLTVEYKMNLVALADGEKLIAQGRLSARVPEVFSLVDYPFGGARPGPPR